MNGAATVSSAFGKSSVTTEDDNIPRVSPAAGGVDHMQTDCAANALHGSDLRVKFWLQSTLICAKFCSLGARFLRA